MEVTFFHSPDELHQWFAQNQHQATELWIGFHKKHTSRAGVTYKQAVDEALCFGWIDGVRKTLDADSYTNRFSPRKTSSIWSTVNLKRAEELIELGRMQTGGLKAFKERDQKKTNLYSFEADERILAAPYAEQFKTHSDAWEFFQAQAPSYQKAANWWVMSAKKAETKLKRLATLIEDSGNHKRLSHLTYVAKPHK